MNTEQLFGELSRRGGWRVRVRRALLRGRLGLLIAAWPEQPWTETHDRGALHNEFKIRSLAEYHRPRPRVSWFWLVLVMAVLELLVKALIQWWRPRREHHSMILKRLRHSGP